MSGDSLTAAIELSQTSSPAALAVLDAAGLTHDKWRPGILVMAPSFASGRLQLLMFNLISLVVAKACGQQGWTIQVGHMAFRSEKPACREQSGKLVSIR